MISWGDLDYSHCVGVLQHAEENLTRMARGEELDPRVVFESSVLIITAPEPELLAGEIAPETVALAERNVPPRLVASWKPRFEEAWKEKRPSLN